MKLTERAPILLTGGTQRVGLHCVERWLEAGEQLIVTYRREKPAVDRLRARGVRCIACDFEDPKALSALIRFLVDDVGALRAIIHNASCWPADSSPEADYDSILSQVWSVHVRAPFLINMACEEVLSRGASPRSDIVHITDYVTERGSDNHIAYAASKAGMANLTLSFAKRFAPLVKVNTICPSLLMFHPEDGEEYRQQTLKKSLLEIEPGAEVIYQTLDYLLRNPYINGRELKLDGGRHLR